MNICSHCNKEFEPKKGQPNQKYCTTEHKNMAMSINRKKRSGVKCKNCNSPIPYGRRKRTCSTECEIIWDGKMAKKKREYDKEYHKEYSPKKPPELVQCDICNTEFETTTNRKYCLDPECIAEGNRRVKAIYMRKYREKTQKEKIKIAEEEEEAFYIDPKFLSRGNVTTSTGQSNL